MLKGYRKINIYLTNWCRNHGFNVRCRLAPDFSYDSDKDIIYYSFVVPEKSNQVFMELFKNDLHNIEECDSFILSFFHELGHYITKNDYDDIEWCDYYDFVESFNKKSKLTKMDYKRYFCNQIEFDASMWACDYINQNTEKISDFFENLQPLILDFFTKNKVALDE